MAKFSTLIRFFFALSLVLMASAGCVPMGDIPTDYSLNLNVDTGQGVLDSINATKNALLEAEAKAGEEVRQTIEDALTQLNTLAADVINLVGDRLDQTIANLDQMIQLKLVWIEHQVEQLHAYALDIIKATGAEARAVINEAELGMRRTIQQTQDAATKTIVTATTGGIIFVNTLADRLLSIGGIAVGILLIFIATFTWGRLIYEKRLPDNGLQRTMSFVLMFVSMLFAILPFSLLYAPLRAYALTSVGQGTEMDLAFKKLVEYRPPQVLKFEPEVVVAHKNYQAAGLVLKGMYLASGLGMPTVKFGSYSLPVNGADDKLTVNIANVVDHPVAANNIQISFGAAGTPTVFYSVPVHTVTPTPISTMTRTVTRTVTRTPTGIPIVAAFNVSTSSGKWPLTVQVTDQSTGGAVAWAWNFGDGSPASTVKNPPAHVYNKAGSYTITLKVTNAKSQSDTATRQITVQNRIGEVVSTIGPFGGFWGDWHSMDLCPAGKLAYGFDIKVEGSQGAGDDTALNGIRLTCGLNNIPTSEITSGQGGWGSWRGGKACTAGEYLTGARMMIEGKQGSLSDDTAADNIAFRCTNGSEQVIGHDAQYGTWSNLQMCPTDTAICGIQTRVESYQGSTSDDTALNDAKFTCCYSR